MNWNAEPRDVVELAALAGDLEAQSTIRMHQSLDRISTSMDKLRDSMRSNHDELIRDLKSLTNRVP